jgi:SAM-dependent methyltransferase
MPWNFIEYIPLRLIRRHVLSDRLLRKIGPVVPYYRPGVGEVDPAAIVDKYIALAGRLRCTFAGKRLLELGPGSTNSTVYELAARGCGRAAAFEPYAGFNEKADREMLLSTCKRNAVSAEVVVSKTSRIHDLAAVRDGTVDAVLSHSVLEHVADPPSLFRMLLRKLAHGGVMLHIVDYRDHFFKYPYHMLLFSKKTWRRWLDPGDLPGWRFGDHLRMLEEAGFTAAGEEIERNDRDFEKIKRFISRDYDRNDPTLAICGCAFVARKRG